MDNMDFERYDKVKCSKIEQMLPKLMKMVEGERERMKSNGPTENRRERWL